MSAATEIHVLAGSPQAARYADAGWSVARRYAGRRGEYVVLAPRAA